MMEEMNLFGAGNKKEKEIVTGPHDLDRDLFGCCSAKLGSLAVCQRADYRDVY